MKAIIRDRLSGEVFYAIFRKGVWIFRDGGKKRFSLPQYAKVEKMF